MTASIYTSLPRRHIRLLRLQQKRYEADEEDSPCVCEMITTDIDAPSRVEYTTLSYTWDDPRPKQDHNDDTHASYQKDLFPVECNGVQIFVRKNLYDALRRYRYFSDVEWIWIDGICIHQSDTDERNAQVELMGEIYSRCKWLLVWLGDSDKHSTRAMPLISKLGEATESDWDDEPKEIEWILNSTFGDSKVFAHFDISPFTSEDWLSIAHFLSRTWFYRVWTIQEYCLPPLKAFVCGRQFKPVVYVSLFCRFLVQLGWTEQLMRLAYLDMHQPFACSAMSNALRLWPGSPTTIQARQLDRWLTRLYGDSHGDSTHRVAAYAGFAVECSRGRFASDPRDKVISPLALASRFRATKTRLVPSPDYSKSLLETYVEFVRYGVTGTRSLAVLSQTVPGDRWQKRDSTLPSWVPDFRHRSEDVFDSFAMNEKFHASMDSAASYVEFPDKSRMQLKGYLLSRVTETCQSSFEMWDFDLLALLRLAKETCARRMGSSWFENLVHTVTASAVDKLPYTTLRDAFEQQLAFMIFANHDIQRRGGRFRRDDDISSIMQTAHQHALEVSSICGGSGISPRREKLDLALQEIQQLGMALLDRSEAEIEQNSTRHEFVLQWKPVRNAIRDTMGQRRFLATEIGAMGIGPEKSLAGDEVWILRGARVPILLRPIREQAKVVVGETYLHGMMNGEPFGSGLLSFDHPEVITLE